MAEIKKRVTPHALRHSFATHLLEQNTDVRGHAKLDTTALYAQVATNVIRAVESQLNRLTPLTTNVRVGSDSERLRASISLPVSPQNPTFPGIQPKRNSRRIIFRRELGICRPLKRDRRPI